MVELLAKKFIPNYDDVSNAEVRHGYGALCGGVGIVLNIILFIIKVFAGVLSGSVAILADAFNNLGDAGSSVVMMVGFKMATKKPDPDHPFGHGRIEYVTGLVISMLIILMSAELIKSSVGKIIHPQPLNMSIFVLVILVISVFIKLYMYMYNTKISTKLSSATIRATAKDSLSDAVATFAVLIVMLIGFVTGVNLDGIVGLVVSAFILYNGITSAKDTIDPLLGSRPDPEYVKTIEKYVASFDEIIGVHDLVVHDYGPGRTMISLHAEVPATGNILDIHDTIDNIERTLNKTLHCHSVIHMDPVVVDDEVTTRMRRLTELIVKSVDENFSIHDFRMVKGPTHTNLIFDVVVPFDAPLAEEEVKNYVCRKVEELPGNHYAVIEIDRPMV